MPKSRSPVLGYNHNIRHKGWVFHVQTEDSGILSPHIFTHLFHEGVIIASKKLEYDPDSDDDIVKGLMQALHKSVMKELARGSYDAKIDAYLGPAPADDELAIPQDLPEDAGATIPTPPPEEVIDLEAGSSTPYAQLVMEDDSQAVVSGTLDVASERIMLMDDTDTDDEINGLLNRLREETPAPTIQHAAVPAPVSSESPGTWIVARPGQKERPFDRSGPIPIPVRDDANRRVLTPPQLEIPQPRTQGAPPRPVTPAPVMTRPPGTVPPAARRPTGRTLTPPAVVQPRSAQVSSQPSRPVPPVPSRTAPHATPVLPRPQPPPPSVTPVLPRGTPAAARPPPVPVSSVNPSVASRPSAPMPAPRPPQLPATGARAPQQTAPLRPVATPTPQMGSGLVPGSPSSMGRRPSAQESVVVARPAVVIGAPPTVIGSPPTDPPQRRPHGRETGESLFGQDLITEKSLDEVIMAYLSEESNED